MAGVLHIMHMPPPVYITTGVYAVCNPTETFPTYSNTQDFVKLPHTIFSSLQGTENPNTNQTLQRAKNACAPYPSTAQQTQLLSA